MVLTVAGKDKVSFLNLLLRVVGKTADLNKFVRGQIVVAKDSEQVSLKLHDW